MKTLTRPELLEKLNNVVGNTFGTIEAVTRPATKKNSPLIEKRSRVNGAIGHSYENSVNNQRKREDKEADFKSDPRVWGKRLNAIIVANGLKRYLSIKVEKAEKPEYFQNGVRVDYDSIKQYLVKKSESSRQELDKKVVVRNYDIDNIVKITMNGETYDVV